MGSRLLATGQLGGACTDTARSHGFVLERHNVPAGEFGELAFRTHLVVVERSPEPFRLTWKDDGKKRTAESGPGYAFVRSQQLIRSLWIGGRQQCLALSIDADAMELALPEPFSGRAVELAPRAIGCDSIVNHLFAALEEEFDKGDGAMTLLLDLLGKAIAVSVASRFAIHPPALAAGRRGLDSLRLERVIDYIECHLADDLALDELARIACLSSFHFSRMFKVSMGESVHQFVLRRRIVRSKHLLAQKRCNLREVAAAVGFHGQSQFTRTFRQLVGLTPRAWRLDNV
jgi:AraC family transcriptional regulator